MRTTDEYVRLATGRVVYSDVVALIEYVEALGCAVTVDDEGEVQIANDDRLPIETIYDLQSSSRSVGYILAARHT